MNTILGFFRHPVRDYRRLTLKRLPSEEFNHLFYLIFWPLYPPIFNYLEYSYPVTYHTVYHPIDSMIPFCEVFLIPYLFWFAYLFLLHLYTLLYDIDAFKCLMRFIIITYALTLIIYFIFPTQQNLRPDLDHFTRSNFFIRYLRGFYLRDTNTNVCPSLHVLGTFAGLYGQWNARGLKNKPSHIIFSVNAVLICLSTLFLKQHSVIDVAAALPVGLIALVLCELWRKKASHSKRSTSHTVIADK